MCRSQARYFPPFDFTDERCAQPNRTVNHREECMSQSAVVYDMLFFFFKKKAV